jgi:hypothetical protein
MYVTISLLGGFYFVISLCVCITLKYIYVSYCSNFLWTGFIVESSESIDSVSWDPGTCQKDGKLNV